MHYNNYNIYIFTIEYQFFLLISGPFYRYRTYYDFINLPYWKYADCQKQTNKRIILAPMAALAFYLMSQIFPHSVRILKIAIYATIFADAKFVTVWTDG